jgi:uncharacterized protein
MKIAIISDIHDNLVNLEKCLDWCAVAGIGELICCGDVTNAETIAFLAKNFSGRIHLVRGNMEIFEDEETAAFENFNYYGRTAKIRIGGRKIGICHEPFWIDGLMADEAPEIIFYGHTHKPWQEKRGDTVLVNPGTLGGVFQKASFAVFDADSGSLELKVLGNL